jgi:hypothetical protein
MIDERHAILSGMRDSIMNDETGHRKRGAQENLGLLDDDDL